jgi:hypothetical protein
LTAPLSSRQSQKSQKKPVETDSRIRVPLNIRIEPQSSIVTAKLGNQALSRFQRAAYKIVFRVRADKRIRALKRVLQSGQIPECKPPKVIEYVEPVEFTPLPERIHRYLEPNKVPVQLPVFPDMFQPRPIEMVEPTFAEKMGYTPIPAPTPKLCFRIQVPKLIDTQGI